MSSRIELTHRIEQAALRAVAALNRFVKNRLGFPFATLLGVLTIIFVVRCCVVAQHVDMGSDIATYLSTMNTLFGHDVAGVGLNRPPLIGLILKPFALIFGDLAGVKALGALISVAIGIPFYLLAKRISRPWIAVAMTLVFVLMPAYSDMLTWGYLTMFGMFFIMLTLHFLLRVLEEPSWLNIFCTGLSASFVVGFHQLSLAFFAPLCLLLLVALLAFNRLKLVRNFRPLVAAIAVAVILSIPYIPIYLKLLRLQAPAASDVPLISLTPMTQIQAGFDLQVDPSWIPWLLGIVLLIPLATVTLRSTWHKDRNLVIMLLVAFFYSLALILFVFPPPFLELNRRAHHFLYIPLWLLAGLSMSYLWSWQRVRHRKAPLWVPKALVAVLILVLLSTTILQSWRRLQGGLDYYGYLDDIRWDAVERIRENTPEESSVAAYPETFGWWIEAEAARRTANVGDRDTLPLDYLRERSLVTERILSRNQGFENGNLRLATTYPYGGAPGQPVLGVYAGGSYHDVMVFDHSNISLSMANGEVANLAGNSEKEFSISGDGDSMTMMTRYLIDGAQVVQTATLDRGSRAATISCNIHSDGIPVTRLDIPVFFGFEPESVSIAPDQTSVEVVQFLRPDTDRVVTRITISVEGATVQQAVAGDDQIGLSFSLQSNEATIAFGFDVAEPELDSDADVIHYDVPEIIRNTGLEHLSAIDFLAVDLKPNPNLASAIAWGTEEWLNACPYYKLVYREGDIRIYEVDASTLP
ncbi:MAG: glycosyltransferase family 39 protein [Dehalococcoidia bacterium]|nr:glycosyltransferase family 39 protein [Dehalococcoidia bacterium]